MKQQWAEERVGQAHPLDAAEVVVVVGKGVVDEEDTETEEQVGRRQVRRLQSSKATLPK